MAQTTDNGQIDNDRIRFWPRGDVLTKGAFLVCLLTLSFIFVGCQSEEPVNSETDIVSTETAVPLTIAPTETPLPEPTSIPSSEPTASQGLYELGESRVRASDGMTQLYVPAGTFMMGSPDELETADANEKPQHEVTLDPFWIDQTEVAVAQFRLFVAETGYETTAEQQGSGFIYEGTWRLENGAMWEHPNGPDSEAIDDHPVTQISWDDAVAYCSWVDSSLPTEAQWEYAARGIEGWLYPWGNDFDSSKLNYCDANCEQTWRDENFDDGYAQTAPVGSFPAGSSWVGAGQ